MSKRELGRVEVLARVRSKQLRVVDAGRLLRVSYRQAKRLWKRYREEGAAGLQHRSAGRSSNRAHEEKFRQKVLRRVREKYSGAVGEGLGPTLAAEHWASEDGLKVHAETLRRWMLAEGLWSGERKRRRHLLRRGCRGSGCRRATTRGERRPAEGSSSEKESWQRWRRGRRRPGPPLRPNRSALRAPQGYAPGQADDKEKKKNEKQKGDISNEVRMGTF
jgi:transposase